MSEARSLRFASASGAAQLQPRRRTRRDDALKLVHTMPGLEDQWQTEKVLNGPEKEHNAKDDFIGNLGGQEERALYIKLSARPDGSFTVTNSRNGFSKTYAAR